MDSKGDIAQRRNNSNVFDELIALVKQGALYLGEKKIIPVENEAGEFVDTEEEQLLYQAPVVEQTSYQLLSLALAFTPGLSLTSWSDVEGVTISINTDAAEGAEHVEERLVNAITQLHEAMKASVVTIDGLPAISTDILLQHIPIKAGERNYENNAFYPLMLEAIIKETVQAKYKNFTGEPPDYRAINYYVPDPSIEAQPGSEAERDCLSTELLNTPQPGATDVEMLIHAAGLKGPMDWGPYKVTLHSIRFVGEDAPLLIEKLGLTEAFMKEVKDTPPLLVHDAIRDAGAVVAAVISAPKGNAK